LGYAGTVSTACQEIHEIPRTFLSKDDAKKQKKNPTFLRSRRKCTRLGDAYTVLVTCYHNKKNRD
jgi:hypothetical protein